MPCFDGIFFFYNFILRCGGRDGRIALSYFFLKEINVFGEHVAIIILSEEPTALLIQNKLLAQSFLAYFESLWLIAEA